MDDSFAESVRTCTDACLGMLDLKVVCLMLTRQFKKMLQKSTLNSAALGSVPVSSPKSGTPTTQKKKERYD